MKNPMKLVLPILLAAVITLVVSACGSTSPTPTPGPAETPEPTETLQTEYKSGSLSLHIPEEYAELITVTTGENPLFSVTEIASQEAAKSRNPNDWEGAGWLFSISRISEEDLHKLLCQDMSGRRAIGRDDSGYVYLAETPTDVRLERSGEFTQEDMNQWTALTEWVGRAVDDFAVRNGLTKCSYGNSELDILLAQIAWGGETGFSLTGLAHGSVTDQGGLSTPFAEQILTSAGGFLHSDRTTAPDGEYLILTGPGENTYFRFYSGENGQFVLAHNGDFEWFLRTADGTDAAQLVTQWYEALSSKYADKLQAAADDVLAEYAALTNDALKDFDESAHPELPWYTAVIANPVRNNLYFGWYDFDTNGTSELVIAAGDEDHKQPMALYAFDGKKMVYLCKEHPLGERSSLTYFQDGLFAVQSSGGAATGCISLWRIAADGYSTEIINTVNYEYKDESTVVYTQESENASAEGFHIADYLTGFSVPIEYTLFATKCADF